MTDCIFCKIVAGEIPAEIVAESDNVIAFRDLNPGAPTHVLLIPREHYVNAAELGASNPAVAGELLAMAAQVASDEGLTTPGGPASADEGYRLVANTGAHAGQSVFHVHFHLLGGRELGWPPG